MGSLRECFVTIPNRQVTFIFKTDGVRIWGALKNFSAQPQQLMPRYDLLACRTSVQWFRIPDKGVILIPQGRKGQGFCILDQLPAVPENVAHVGGSAQSGWILCGLNLQGFLQMALAPAGHTLCAASLFAFLFRGKRNLHAACPALQRKQRF